MALPLEKVIKPNGYLSLPVEKPIIPDAIKKEAEKNELSEKPEFHISVLVEKNAQLAWKAVEARPDVAELRIAVENLFKNRVWEYSLTNEYFLHERVYSKDDLRLGGYPEDIPARTRRSIVQKVRLPDLTLFYAHLNEKLGTSLPVPVPHITLFFWTSCGSPVTQGIGINSGEEFTQFTKRALTG